ncbi:MAG: mechanosensitive ion channel family protein [Bacilli bacterium]|nr:mechanosensitive ion channel family protein [Bacilli bacterium]
MVNYILSKEIVSSFFTIVIAVLVYHIVRQIILKMFMASKKYGVHKKSVTITNMFITIIKYIFVVIVILTLLSIWGIDTKALIASLGVVGLVAGLALQDILKDFLAGFSIIIDNEFDVGDNIKVNNFRGTVIELGMKNTKIRAYSGEVLIVANRNINEVINYSTQDSRCIIDVSVSYDSDLDKIERVLNEVCIELRKNTNYLTSDMEVLGVQELGDNAVVFRVIADCAPTRDIDFKRKAQRAIKDAFDYNGIEIPFPQVVVHNE